MKFTLKVKIWGTRIKRSNKEIKSVKKTSKTEEFERCILCGAITEIPISMPIDLRENYEVGVGQICDVCAGVQHDIEVNEKNVLTQEQIIIAVEQSIEN